MREKYGLSLKTELHAAELIRVNKTDEYKKISKSNRVMIIKEFIRNMPIIFNDAKIINVCFRKEDHPEVPEFQTIAWTRLIQRYDTYLKKTATEKGIIVCDDSDEPLIRGLLRKMRVYNPVPSHFTDYYNVPTDNIIEDVFTRRSHHSYYIQAVDFVSHILYRKEYPKGSLKKFGLEKLFDDLEPILFKQASKSDPLGIVRK